jgi:N-acetyl-alpha-D-muramate 1-phosphate uridylyltransferase
MKAMIFAAGLGTRLGDITKNIPKALVDINGKSILELAVEKLVHFGFDDIIVNIHHFAPKVKVEISKLQQNGYNITISDESDMLLDTGGGLQNAMWFFGKDPFLVYNVDIITDLNLSDLYSYHIANSAFATLAVRDRPGNRFFLVDKNSRLKGWRNKATNETIFTGSSYGRLSEVAFSGIHIINPAIIKYMQKGVYSMTSLYMDIASREKIMTFKSNEGYWIDIGTVEKLEYCREMNLR